jgi:predicted HicB family RNase H-like nuclease
MAFRNQKLKTTAQEAFITGAPDEPKQVQNQGGRPKSRKDTKRITVYLDQDLHEDLSLYAGAKGKSLSLLINDACKGLIAVKAKAIKQLKEL